MTFQVGNVENLNKSENTFSITEAKDYKVNLALYLERFKARIEQFSKVKWENKYSRIFLFGDYEFLRSMYGLSCASGRYPCLWCQIPSSALAVCKDNRENMYSHRSLVTLRSNLNLFQVTFNHNLKQTKNAYDVIDDFFNISLDHVCIPGLHARLYIYKTTQRI